MKREELLEKNFTEEIEVEISVEEVEKKKIEVISDFTSHSKIPGFRRGNAPSELVKSYFNNEIKEKIINELIQIGTNRSIKKSEKKPLHPPLIKDIEFEEGKPLKFKIIFEYLPEYDVEDYIGVNLEIRKTKVEEENIETVLKELQDNAAEFIPVENRGIQDGDFAVFEVQKKIIETKRLLPKERLYGIMGKEVENIPGLYQNILNLKMNEEKTYTADYPDDFPKKNLAGKKIEHKIKVIQIKEKKLPEINDEFAKDLGNYQNLEDLKNKIRESLEKRIEINERKILKARALEKIREKNEIVCPKYLEELEIEYIMERIIQNTQVPLTPELEEKLREENKAQARENVKNYLILRKIAEKEKIYVNDNEIEEELKNIATQTHQSFEKVKNTYENSDLKEKLRRSLLMEKTLDFLINKAIIKYKEDS
ncbi:MAG: trigger factor [Acidobacteriota bacterium]